MMNQWHNASYFTPDLLIQRFNPPWDPLDPGLFEPLIEYQHRLPAEHQTTLFLKGLELQRPRSSFPVVPSIADVRGSAYFPPRNGSNASSGLREELSMNDLYSPPNQIYQPNLNGPDRLINSRHGSIDSFGNAGPQSAQISSAHESPAFANALSRSYGSQSGPLTDDRNRWFNLRDEPTAPSRSNGLSGISSSGLMYDNSLGGQNSQSPYPGASPLASHQSAASYPSNQSPHPMYSRPYSHNASNVGPRLTQNLYSQQSASLLSGYQQAQPVNAWNQPPSGHVALARQSVPRPPRLPEDPPTSSSTASTWGALEPSRTSPVNSDWIPDQTQGVQISNEPLEWKSPAFESNAQRYSTSVALQQVQAHSAGNFGLVKGFVEPPTLPPNSQTEALAPTPLEGSAAPAPRPSVPAMVYMVDAASVPVPVVPSNDMQESSPVAVARPPATKPASPIEPKDLAAPRPSKSRSSVPLAGAVRTKSEATTTVTEELVPEPATPAEPPQPSKPAWGATPVTQASGASLREIQEAETKMAEARKAAEQKEKAARTAVAAQAPTPGDDVPKVTSWGLPHVRQKSSASASSITGTTPPVHAWSTASVAKQPAKKTMKEIQEEEERGKKAQAVQSAAVGASDSAFVVATARRAYVDTARSAESLKVI